MDGKISNTEIDFPCFRCGVCCTCYQVYIKLPEAKELAANLKLSLGEFLNSYTDPHWPGKETFLIRHQNGACIFLKRTQGGKVTQCSIHAFRPQDCRNWIPKIDKPECQKGLSAWGLQVSSTGELSGATENLKRFSLLLESLNTD